MHRQLILAALLTTFASLAHAQFEDASGTKPAPTVSLTEAALRSPAIASVLESPRETPAQQLEAIFTLLDLGAHDVAASLWSEFATDQLDEQAAAALVRQFGVARFLSLSRTASGSGLDGATAFAETALKSAAKLGRDPEQLAKLIASLGDASDEVRRAARSDLRVTGEMGAVACLGALATAPAGDAGEPLRAQLLLTLANMRPTVEPMLIAALAGGEGQFRRDVVELSGYLYLQDAIPWLAAIAVGADANEKVVAAAHAALVKMGFSSPSAADTRAVILSEITRLETHQNPPAIDRWWSFQSGKLSGIDSTPENSKLLSVARLSRLLSELPGAGESDQRFALVYAYQTSKLLDQPLDEATKQFAESLDINQLNETLHLAVEHQQISAAIACAELLGARGEESALVAFAGRPSPLAAALSHPQRELRYAALDAIMKIKPQSSFAGASGVAKALWQFASSSGNPQVVVASSVKGKASQWGGMLRGLGYDVTPVTTGRQALLAALNSPRLELLLIDSDIGRPLLREVVYGLRGNPQLRQMPIAVLSSLDNLARAASIAEVDPWLLATPRPHSVEGLQTVLNELSELSEKTIVADRRKEQAIAALGWLADLLETGHPYDELLRNADQISRVLYDPALSKASVRVLGSLSTASSQQLLVDLASSPNQPLELRRLAGDAFGNSVGRFGKLLTADQIVRQYDRYNASETANEETQKVLSGLLDVLEKKK